MRNPAIFEANLALEAIQKRALAEGLPYQTPISSLLHGAPVQRVVALDLGEAGAQ